MSNELTSNWLWFLTLFSVASNTSFPGPQWLQAVAFGGLVVCAWIALWQRIGS